jgi:hypothetical protein
MTVPAWMMTRLPMRQRSRTVTLGNRIPSSPITHMVADHHIGMNAGPVPQNNMVPYNGKRPYGNIFSHHHKSLPI